MDANLKAKELCNQGICASMSEARRLLCLTPKDKLDIIIQKKINEQKKTKEKGNNIEETIK